MKHVRKTVMLLIFFVFLSTPLLLANSRGTHEHEEWVR
jgi:hypothetical protein